MKKILFAVVALMGLMVISCTDSEPTIVGKWQCDSTAVEKGNTMKMSFVMDLKADGTALNAVNASMDGEEEGMKMHIPFGVEFGGTWSVNEDVLTLVVDSNSVKINFVADSLKIESTDPEKAALVDMMKGKMAKSLEEEMNKKDGEFIKGIYPEEGTQEFTFVLKGDELTLTEKKDSVGAPQLFKRVK